MLSFARQLVSLQKLRVRASNSSADEIGALAWGLLLSAIPTLDSIQVMIDEGYGGLDITRGEEESDILVRSCTPWAADAWKEW